MDSHRWGKSWMDQGMNYRKGIALDNVGKAKTQTVRREKTKRKKWGIFIVCGLIQWEVK